MQASQILDANQWLDALSASFFGLLGIWAAVDRRHWFLRLAVVGSMLFGSLLIPAYEVVVEFGLQMSLIMLGVWWARGRESWRPRLSMETALFAMVIVAVGSAVAARLPEWHAQTWIFLIGVGTGTAAAGLLCLWVVFGRASLRRRLLLLPVGLATFLLLFQLGAAVGYALRMRDSTDWITAIDMFYNWEYAQSWYAHMIPTTLLGTSIILLALVVGRATRWFTAPDEDVERDTIEDTSSSADESVGTGADTAFNQPFSWHVYAARAALAAIFASVGLPLLYVFYRLMTPMPIPAVKLPSPNGFDDFVAAGLMVPPVVQQTLLTQATSDAQLAVLLKDVQPVLERIELGLSRESYAHPASRTDVQVEGADQSMSEERTAIESAMQALMVKLFHDYRHGSIEDRVAGALQMERFVIEASRGDGLALYNYLLGSSYGINELQSMAPDLDAAQCRSAAQALMELEASRETWDEMALMQRARDENRNWTRRLNIMLDELSDRDPYEWARRYHRQVTAQIGMLIVRLALRAYVLEQGDPPDKLSQLMPEYLNSLPVDPFDDSSDGPPLRYVREPDAVRVYSVGYDGEDDGGVEYAVDSTGIVDESDGDQVELIKLSELEAKQTTDDSAAEDGSDRSE